MMATLLTDKLPRRLQRVLARLEQVAGVDEQLPRRPEAVAGLYKLVGDQPERAVELLLRADLTHHHCTGQARVFADADYAHVCLHAKRLPAHIEYQLEDMLIASIRQQEDRYGKPCLTLADVGAPRVHAVN